ncbi:MAG: hypothetical protein IK062_04575 [Selenomonadaceae bacterium]|nr:hypothetical protein [Selenomonadaceae bacterium]
MLKKSFVWSLIFSVLFFCTSDKISAKEKFKFDAPNPSTEFSKMDFPQLYPTYSWEPLPNTEFYQVQVVKIDGTKEKIVRELKNQFSLSRVTDSQPFNEEGKYFWKVRVIDKKNKPLSDWSEKKFFTVEMPVNFAVLGDSISHGGSNFIPAGQLSCQWETYCEIPVKNLARSGDTTQMMIERFDADILPFQPKILIIMGGVNDIREGKNFDEVIKNLEILREKCLTNNIEPIFCTITPMNEKIISGRKIFLTDNDWRTQRKKINSWILENGGIDVSSKLEDENGELQEKFTVDGLHPDLRGKILIGKSIEKSLKEKFGDKNVF